MMATYGKMKSVHYPDVETWSLTVTHDDWNEAIPVGEERNVDRLLAELEALRARAEQAEAENARLVEVVELAKTVAQAHCDDMEQEPLLGDFAILTKIEELATEASESHASVEAATDGTKAEPRYAIHDVVALSSGIGIEYGVITDVVTRNGKTVYQVHDNSHLNIKEEWIIKKIGERRIDAEYLASWLKSDITE
jgi:hypothetical protein